MRIAPLVACLAAGAVLLAGCAQVDPNSSPSPSTATSSTTRSPASTSATASASPSRSASPSTPTTTASAVATVSCTYTPSGSPARPVDPPPSTDVPAAGTLPFVMTMNEGKLTLTLDRGQAPCAVNSFVALVKQKFYDDTSCHRLVDVGIFILQCGDPTGTGSGGPGYVFGDELTGKETYPAGTIAMANQGKPGTNGSQFFIVYQDSQLPATYTIIGKIAPDQMGPINRIAEMGNDGSNPAGGGKPINPARIVSITAG